MIVVVVLAVVVNSAVTLLDLVFGMSSRDSFVPTQ
jgi:hypothetical protein